MAMLEREECQVNKEIKTLGTSAEALRSEHEATQGARRHEANVHCRAEAMHC